MSDLVVASFPAYRSRSNLPLSVAASTTDWRGPRELHLYELNAVSGGVWWLARGVAGAVAGGAVAYANGGDARTVAGAAAGGFVMGLFFGALKKWG